MKKGDGIPVVGVLPYVLAAVFVICPSFILFGLDVSRPITSYLHHHWDSNDGLSQNSVMAILQTRDGYIWLATQDGFVRFNGMDFRVFDIYNTPQLRNNYVKTLFEDKNGGLWIGTQGGGITRLFEGGFTHFSEPREISELLINTIWEHPDGSIWFGTWGHGVLVYRSGAFSFIALTGGEMSGDVFSIAGDARGNIWVGTDGDGLVKITGTQKKIYTQNDGLPSNRIKTILCARDGTVWLGTANGGLCRYNEKDDSFTIFDKKNGLTGNHVNVLAEDGAGGLWIGNYGSGLNRYANGTFHHYTSEDGLGNDAVSAILEDREGCIWVGTEGGGLERFKDKHLTMLGKRDGLSNNMVFPIISRPNGDLYVGTRGGGVNVIRNGKVTIYNEDDGLPNNQVFSIYVDDEENLWAGTFGGGLCLIRNGKIEKIYTEKNGLCHNFIWAMTGDGDGVLWIGTNGGGISLLKDGVFSNLTTRQGLTSDRISVMMEDSKGNMWVGTYGGGLNVIRGERPTGVGGKGGTKTWNIENLYAEDKVAGNVITALYEDEDGVIWVGSKGGLHRIKGDRYTRYVKADGLFDNLAWHILEDNKKNLWMSCNKGIYRVSRAELNDFADGKIKTLNCMDYGTADGMENAECNGVCQPAGARIHDGRLAFPTIRGVVLFEPDRIEMNTWVPPVFIERVDIDHKRLPNTSGAVLPPGSRSIEIRFAGLSYREPEAVRYSHRLTPYETNWSEPGGERKAFYMNLPPGRYRFQVRACNNDGVWNNDGAEFRFTVEPYYYQNPLFYIFSVLALLLVTGTAYIYRIRRLKQREESLEQLVSQRTRELEKAKERAMREREAADAANQSKSEFLARMSHEIRTPMNSVIGFSDMLMETGLNEEQADLVATISRSGETLITIINDILDFSKIEAGQLRFDYIDFDPEVTAYDVCDLILPRLSERRVDVLCRIGDRVPGYVRHDPGRFRQVLVNLMSNAAKFTRQGEILLSMDLEDESDDGYLIRTTVRDTGIGIPQEKLDDIFEVFQQADGSITRKFGGTGLGLAICKQIAHAMGGDITVESEVGKGSAFHFTAWMKKSAASSSPVVHERLRGKRVLAADHNGHNLEIVAGMLARHGMTVDTATVTDHAEAMIERAAAEKTFWDLCILDVQMAGVDGYRLAEMIRRLPAPFSAAPLLASSTSTSRQTQRYTDSGFDAFLTKPVQAQKLFRLVERLLLPQTGRDDDEHRNEPRNRHAALDDMKHSVSILLAEDNPVNRKLARYMLKKGGYLLEVANNGKEAVDIFTASPEQFDLIFMDIQMPEMDGREATRIIRKKGFDKIPIIAMTAESMPGDREKCIDAGMNDYIAKPIRRDLVFEMIKKWVLKKS